MEEDVVRGTDFNKQKLYEGRRDLREVMDQTYCSYPRVGEKPEYVHIEVLILVANTPCIVSLVSFGHVRLQ